MCKKMREHCALQVDGSGTPAVVPTEVALVCPRQQAPKSGQEVTISYGDKSNEMLLMSYGMRHPCLASCRDVLCCAVLCCGVLCCAVLCCAVPCRAVPCHAVPCCAVLSGVACTYLGSACCGLPQHPALSKLALSLLLWQACPAPCAVHCVNPCSLIKVVLSHASLRPALLDPRNDITAQCDT